MNARFLVCMGYVSSEDDSKYPVLLGLVDTTNVRNTVSCRDILTNTRICKTVYNLGIELTCNGYPFSSSNNSWLLGLTADLRNNIEPTAFKIIDVQEDVWNYEDIIGDMSNPAIVQFKQDIKDNLRDEVSDEDLTTVVQKLFNDTSAVIMDQYSYTADGVTPTDHSIDYRLSGCLYLGEQMDNVQTDLSPISIGVGKLPMDSETTDIPFPVPSFYDIMCSNRYFKDKEMRERMPSDDDEDADTTTVDSRMMSTTLFSEDKIADSNDYSFESIYLGENNATASPFLMANFSVDIPLINPKTINVASVTQFWNVMPAVKLPPASFNKKADGSSYKLEDLIGYDSNNNLKLQDNERRFYNALVSLLEVAIGIEYGAIAEELYQENKEKKSRIVEDYLRTMSQEAFDLMWRHTGTTNASYTDDGTGESSSEVNEVVTFMKLPCLYGEVRKDSDSGRFVFVNKLFKDSTDVANAGKYIHAVMPRLGLGFDGGAMPTNNTKKDNSDSSGRGGLAGFVERNPSNKRWIDAYIRLLRWGSRKPTKLSLERLVDDDDANPIELTDPKYWDLNTSASSMHDGIIDNLVPIVDEETGSEYTLDRIVVQPNVVIPVGILKSVYGSTFDYLGNQTELSINLPIGVVLRKSYKDSAVETTIFEDIFTFYNKLKKGDVVYGPIKYNKDNAVFMTFNGHDNLFVDIVELGNILDSIHTRSDVIYDASGKPYTIYYTVSTNADVVKARTVASNAIIDAFLKKSYKEQCEHISLFTAFSEFAVHPSKKSYIEDGKAFDTNPSAYVKTPDESHRLIYQYLDKYCQLPCKIETIEETEIVQQYNDSELVNVEEKVTKSCVDIIDVLNNVEKLYCEKKKPVASVNASVGENVDICWEEFKALISANPNGYKFRGFTVNDTDYPFMLGCALDRANMKYLVLTVDNFHKLEEDLGVKLQCVKGAFSMSDKKKFFEIQKNILRYYQSIGRNLTSSKCNIGGFDYYLSSTKLPRRIYDYNKK